jgi:quinoprotein glucose dehydrogenase
MKRSSTIITAAVTLGLAFSIYACWAQVAGKPKSRAGANTDWPVYGGQTTNQHYSSLTQINRSNVNKLKAAWTYDTGEEGILETNPVVVGRTLYAYTPSQKVIALDAVTGKLLWKFDAGIKAEHWARGVSYWTDGQESRIFAGVMNSLYALDPTTGKPVQSFGENGKVDLRKNLRGDYNNHYISMDTPGVIYKDLIIVGGEMPETLPAAPGDIRAYDVRTGELRWSFHTIPHPGEFGYKTWPEDSWKTSGAANNWAGMSLDAARGIVYVPTGSAAFDFYGGDRIGNDLFADTLLALDANTGKRIWHFQDVHHDLWDRDFPAAPVLLTVVHDGKRIDAVAQTTKTGYLYLFDRSTGKPLFPIEEHSYPASTIPGEVASPTQPRPLKPAPYARQLLTEDMLTNRTPEAHAWALEKFRTFRSEGLFVPFELDKQTVLFPGFDGGAEWGGPAVDPRTGVIYINSNDVAWTGGLTADKPAATPGEAVYRSQCSICHGVDRSGSPPTFPSLNGVSKRLSETQIVATIHQGKGRMPAFPDVSGTQLQSLLQFLNQENSTAKSEQISDKQEAPSLPNGAAPSPQKPRYSFTGYRRFVDPDNYPAVAPPWGTLSAIDLNTGAYLWKIPFGEYPALVAKGMKNTGSENYGGPIVTASGLLFIGATLFDHKFRAFDSHTGNLLWETQLPYAGRATPATYMVDGKQYVVLATGAVRFDPAKAEGVYVAFSLP